MFSLERDKDTICAVATPPGIGGISVIRLSGTRACEIARCLCDFLPETPKSHNVYYGFFCDLKSKESIDEVLVSYFSKDRSFTGEETIEVSCHGSPIICSQIIAELICAGARLAQKGEFTYRAFSNGRIDLVQAESVLSLIESESKKASQLSLRQLKGALSTELSLVVEDLTFTLAHIEANIDFAAEDIEIKSSQQLLELVTKTILKMNALLMTYKQGRILNNGFRVAIVGAPNVGKSTLLNCLLGEEKAIVTDLPGTTRDFIEAKASFGGQIVEFIDTAGIREAKDIVEEIGIKRAHSVLEDVDHVFIALDLSGPLKAQVDEKIFKNLKNKSVTFVCNKVDIQSSEYSEYSNEELLLCALPHEPIRGKASELNSYFEYSSLLRVSAKEGLGMQALSEHIHGLVSKEFSESSALLSQSRHFELLTESRDLCLSADTHLKDGGSPELIALDLQEALKCVHEILGHEFNDQVMDRVFKEFCLGK